MTDGQPAAVGESGGRGTAGLSGLVTATAIARQRRFWSGRVASWDRHGSVGLRRVTAAVLDAANVAPGDRVADLGCGTGQLSLPLAERGARVLAVDVSPAMVAALREEAHRRGLAGVEPVAVPVERMSLPDRSLDLIVSSYALHHLRDRDKAAVMTAAARWLRPGGRLVLADMMFGRGGTARDRQIIAAKVAVLARRGPGGWWRIAKNAARYQLRIAERPVSMDAWVAMLAAGGFENITTSAIVAEAGLIIATRPA